MDQSDWEINRPETEFNEFELRDRIQWIFNIKSGVQI